MFSMMLVQAKNWRSLSGRSRRTTVSIPSGLSSSEPDAPAASRSSRWVRLLMDRSARSASFWSQACRRTFLIPQEVARAAGPGCSASYELGSAGSACQCRSFCGWRIRALSRLRCRGPRDGRLRGAIAGGGQVDLGSRTARTYVRGSRVPS